MKRVRRGFFLPDVIVGLTLIGTVAGMLAVATNRQQSALIKFANDRAATRLAQDALDQLNNPRRAGRLQRPADPRVHIQFLPTAVTPGKAWIQIDATVNGETETLVGLVAKEDLP